MAYAFDNVMGRLGKKPESENSNVFTGAGGSSTEGELGLTGGGDVANGKTNTSADPSDVSVSAAFRNNQGKTAAPTNLAALKTGVQAKDKALTDEANAYVQKSAGATKLSDTEADQLRGAIDKNYQPAPTGDEPIPGGDPSRPGPSSMAYWSRVASNPVDTVNPFASTTDVTDSTIENLNTDAGVQNLLRKNSGSAEYGAGDAAFDQALLADDAGFQQGRQEVSKAYKGLQDRKNAMEPEVTQRAQAGRDSARYSYLEDMKAKLGGLKSEYETEAFGQEKKMEDEAARRQAILTEGGGQYGVDRAKELAGNASDPLSKYYDAKDLNGQNFIHGGSGRFDAGAQDFKSFLNDDQALRFNNIFGLLGSKDIYGAGNRVGGFADSDLVSNDDAGLKDVLMAGAKKRAAEVDDPLDGSPVVPPVQPGTPTIHNSTITNPDTWRTDKTTTGPQLISGATDAGNRAKDKTPLAQETDAYIPSKEKTKSKIRQDKTMSKIRRALGIGE